MSWITENKKEIVRKAVDLDEVETQALYDELENDKSFCLEKEVVTKNLGLPKDTIPRPQTLAKWIRNAITLNETYDFKIGESSSGCYIFRRIDIEKEETTKTEE